MTITYTIESISPAMATLLLSNQAPNRTLSSAVVASYADAMRRGLWRLTNQGIALDTTGRLIDGQHRLAAVIESGCTVQMMMARGVPAEYRDLIDAGRAQRASDRLTASGIKNANNKVSIVHMMLTSMRLRRSRMDTADHREVIEAIDSDLDLVVQNGKSGIGTAVRAALFIAWTQGSRGEEFVRQMMTGEGLSNGMAAYVLRERLFRTKTTRSIRDSRREEFDRTLFCARAHIQGKQLFTSNKISSEAREFFALKFKSYLVGKGVDVSDGRVSEAVHKTVADLVESRLADGRRKS